MECLFKIKVCLFSYNLIIKFKFFVNNLIKKGWNIHLNLKNNKIKD